MHWRKKHVTSSKVVLSHEQRSDSMAFCNLTDFPLAFAFSVVYDLAISDQESSINLKPSD